MKGRRADRETGCLAVYGGAAADGERCNGSPASLSAFRSLGCREELYLVSISWCDCLLHGGMPSLMF